MGAGAVFHSPNLWSQITILSFPQNGGKPISLQNEKLKPCNGFKPNTYKETGFPKKCAKKLYHPDKTLLKNSASKYRSVY